jgi:hypothetical protein
LNVTTPQFVNFYNPAEWYCMDWSSGDFSWGGYFDGNYTRTIRLDLDYCPDSQPYNSQNCTSMDYINNLNKETVGLQFSMLYPDSYMMSDDLINPLKLTFKTWFKYLNFDVYTTDRLFLENKILLDDQGKIFEDVKQTNLLSYTTNKGEASYLPRYEGGSGNFYTFLYYSEKNSNIIKRSFMKIQDAGALIGGVIKIILVLFHIVSFLPNEIQRENFILNELFQESKMSREDGLSKPNTAITYGYNILI